MHWDRLSRVTAPANSPLDLDAAKAHLRVDFADDDNLIEGFIAAAVAMIDGPRGIGIAMVEQTWRLTLDAFHDTAWLGACRWRPTSRFPYAIPLPMGPVSEIASVSYVAQDGSTVELAEDTDFKVAFGRDPALIFTPAGKCWPIPICEPDAVAIDFVAGFGPKASDVPADLVAALKLLVGHLYANRSAVVGADARVSPDVMPLSAASILDRYRAGLFG